MIVSDALYNLLGDEYTNNKEMIDQFTMGSLRRISGVDVIFDDDK
jgi:hypothetical protein